MSAGAGLAVAVGLLTAVALLVTLLAGLWWFDRCDDEPVGTLVVAGGWGVLAAALVGLGSRHGPVFGQGWLEGGGAGSFLAGLALIALVGQGLLAVGLALLAGRLDGPTDGLLVGCVAGLGWAVGNAAVSPTGALPAGVTPEGRALVTALTLVAAGVGANALAAGTFGGFLGVGKLARRRGLRVLWVSGGLALAVLADAGWRWSRDVVVASGAGWPAGLLLVGVVVALGALLVGVLLRTEGRVLAEELMEELDWRVVPAWVVRTVPSYRCRVRGDWWPERRTRVVVARLLSRLALRKRSVRNLPPGAASLAALEVGKLRSRTRAVLLPERGDED